MGPSDMSEIDRKLIAIFKEAQWQLLADFFDAIKKNNIDRQKFLLTKITGILDHLKTNFGVRAEYTTLYEYISGVSSIPWPDQATLKNIITDLTGVIWKDIGTMNSWLQSLLWVPHQDAVKNLLTNTSSLMINAIDGLWRTTQRQMSEYIRLDLAERLAKGVAIGDSRWKQKQDLIKSIMEKWIVSFRDRGGNNWDLPRYADMIVRTESARAYNQWTLNRWSEIGITKYEIIEQANCCPICLPHRWKIVDITTNPKFPPFHPNCRGFVVAVL